MKSIRRRCMGRGVGAKDNSKSRRYMRPISESQRHEHVLEDVCCRKWNQRTYTNTFANLLIVLSLPSHANRNRGLQHGAHMHTRNKARRSHYYLVCSLRLSLATVSTSANLPGSKDMGTQTRQYPYMYAGCVCVCVCMCVGGGGGGGGGGVGAMCGSPVGPWCGCVYVNVYAHHH